MQHRRRLQIFQAAKRTTFNHIHHDKYVVNQKPTTQLVASER